METTTRTAKTRTSTWVSLLTKSLYFYNWDNENTGVFIIKLCDKSANLAHFIDPQYFALGLLNNFVHFIHPYMNPWPNIMWVLLKELKLVDARSTFQMWRYWQISGKFCYQCHHVKEKLFTPQHFQSMYRHFSSSYKKGLHKNLIKTM